VASGRPVAPIATSNQSLEPWRTAAVIQPFLKENVRHTG
jgi:hypothetical protein